jgi:hypothetical protein
MRIGSSAAVILCALCVGCGGGGYADQYEGDWADSSEDPVAALAKEHEEKLANLYSMVEDVEQELSDLQQSTLQVQSDVERFDSGENWEDVVDDLAVANEQVQQETQELEQAVSELSSSFYQ